MIGSQKNLGEKSGGALPIPLQVPTRVPLWVPLQVPCRWTRDGAELVGTEWCKVGGHLVNTGWRRFGGHRVAQSGWTQDNRDLVDTGWRSVGGHRVMQHGWPTVVKTGSRSTGEKLCEKLKVQKIRGHAAWVADNGENRVAQHS